MYGGIQGFFGKRYFYDYLYRTWFRIAFVPTVFHFVFACLGQREYDNNAYDYFYFSD